MTTKPLQWDSTLLASSSASAHHDAATFGPMVRRQTSAGKPFTVAELQARAYDESYLQLAKSYRDLNDILNAVSCCLEGLALTFGISRPLAVRDQFAGSSGQSRSCGSDLR
jgi:hypothetical protein